MKNDVLNYISYGMYVVGCNNNKKYGGCVINTFQQVTNNGIISINVNKNNATNKTIEKTHKFSVSILSEEIDRNVIATFGYSSSKDTNKFENIEFEIVEEVPILKNNICGYLICEVIDIIDCNTHNMILAKIIRKEVKAANQTPMTYKFYHEVIKGKAPKSAPTYIEEEINENEYICDICGYVHKKEVPDDFICPICGADKTHFKKKKD